MKNPREPWLILLTLIASNLLSGCATMFARKQYVDIASEPLGAKVYVDGQPKGITPCTVRFARGQGYQVELRLDGYQKYQGALYSESFSNPALLLNFVVAPVCLVGIPVDMATGADSSLFPDSMNIRLLKPSQVQPLSQ